MGKHVLSACMFAFVLSFASAAQATPKATGGKMVAYAMPLVAGSIAVWKDDWTGVAQLAVVTTLSVGTAWGIKQIVRERRPYASRTDYSTGWDSFPSTTSALASAPSSFVWSRYGWKWGLPLFIISKYTSYSLDKARKNRIWDGLASTAISWGYNQVITTRYHPISGFQSDLQAGPNGIYASLNYRW